MVEQVTTYITANWVAWLFAAANHRYLPKV